MLTVTQHSQGQSKDPHSPSLALSLPFLVTGLEDSTRQPVGTWLPMLSAPAWAGPRPPLPPSLQHKWMLDMPLIFVFCASLHLSGGRLYKCLPPGKARAGLLARRSWERVSLRQLEKSSPRKHHIRCGEARVGARKQPRATGQVPGVGVGEKARSRGWRLSCVCGLCTTWPWTSRSITGCTLSVQAVTRTCQVQVQILLLDREWQGF